jgi:hypothetical protein
VGWSGYKEYVKEDVTLAIFYDAGLKRWYAFRPGTNDAAIYFRRW